MEFWKQITLGAAGTGLLGADEVVEVVTVADAGACAATGVARAALAFGLDVAGVASSAIAKAVTHSPKAATVRAVHDVQRWGDLCMMLRAYAQG
jgi:hypothetical protein